LTFKLHKSLNYLTMAKNGRRNMLQ